MLHLLQEYAEKHELVVPAGFKPKDVRWAVCLDEQGQFSEIVEIGDVSAKRNQGLNFKMCPDFTFPEMKAGGVTKSHFLVEAAEVIALYGKKSNDQKTRDKHKYFIKLLRDAGSAIPELRMIADCLGEENSLQAIRGRLESKRVKSTDKLTFKIGNSYPVRSDVWHDWWHAFRPSLTTDKSSSKSSKRKGKSTREMRCLMTGDLVEPIRVAPKISGLAGVGGMSTGDALISFKQDSFCSYGFQQATNAAVSEEGSLAYREALNDLIKEHAYRLAGAKVVHWFKEDIPDEDDPLAFLDNPNDELKELVAQHKVSKLLKSIQTGERQELRNNYYYALTLSGAAGRVMVRDWMEGQFEELVENINAWFDDLEIVHRSGGGFARSPKFLAVLGSTVRDLKDLPAPFVAKMWRTAVRNEPIPQSAVADALLRFKVDIIDDKPSNHARMGLMKAYHIRKGDRNMSSALNEEHPNPAYHCGRLMAVLAEVQRAALGDVGAGVVQRYYAAASSTPALVFGRLTNLSQHHLKKLDSPGLAHWYESKIASIWGCIKDNVPATLSLEEQTLFALGYYQQMADRRTKKSDSDEEKETSND